MPIISHSGWRLGLAVCRDSSFPEHARAAALDGCGAYLIAALFPGSRGAHRRATICPTRALDNAIYVATANHCGPSGPLLGCGRSAIWGPTGELVDEADEEAPGIAIGRLEPEVLARARDSDCALLDPSLRAPTHPRRSVILA